jgi:hypothetical protein
MIPMFAPLCNTERDYQALFESFRRKYASYTLEQLYFAKVSFRNNVLAMRAHNVENGIVESTHSITSRCNELMILQLAIAAMEIASGIIHCLDVLPMRGPMLEPSSSQ